MNNYEKEQKREIVAWEKKEPSQGWKLVNTAMKPVEWAVKAVIPPKVIEAALTASDSLANILTDKKDILRDGNVENISDLKTKDLELSDKLANSVHNWAVTLAAAEGGGTGVAGLYGIAIDIPTIITIALRSVHKIALCYGYETQNNNDYERLYALEVISLAGANTMDDKNVSLLGLKQLSVFAKKTTWKKMGELANSKGIEALMSKSLLNVKDIAKKLGIRITKKKLNQAIPIIGSAVGAASNGAWINDVCWAARRCYQKRWLNDNGKWDEDSIQI